jgi:hypothetical protein
MAAVEWSRTQGQTPMAKDQKQSDPAEEGKKQLMTSEWNRKEQTTKRQETKDHLLHGRVR